jgi:hypothetical protein
VGIWETLVINIGHNKKPKTTPQLTTFAKVCNIEVSAKIKQPKTRALVSIDAAIA